MCVAKQPWLGFAARSSLQNRPTARQKTSPKSEQQGWLLLAVIVIVMLISLGVVMLMSQAQLSLKSVAQEHQAMQEKIDQWPPLLDHKADIDAH